MIIGISLNILPLYLINKYTKNLVRLVERGSVINNKSYSHEVFRVYFPYQPLFGDS